jgi:hypothetical protein
MWPVRHSVDQSLLGPLSLNGNGELPVTWGTYPSLRLIYISKWSKCDVL